jgi:transcriptional regulator with XRE-family HTH domain
MLMSRDLMSAKTAMSKKADDGHRGSAADGARSVSRIDRAIASLLRRRREEMGLSRIHVAHQLGITDRQVEKYESGRNRISAGRLAELAIVLGVSVAYFFDSSGTDASDDNSNSGMVELIRLYRGLSASDQNVLIEKARELSAKPHA